MNKNIALLALICIAATAFSIANAAQHHMPKETSTINSNACPAQQASCAKTMTSAFAPNGELWRVWAAKGSMYYQVSSDLGKTFAPTQHILLSQENIAARNENRPKIAFDQHNGVYLSWARSGEKRFTGDIRFSYSADGGKQFTPAITINNDNLITGHSFNEMRVSPDGDVTLVWLDSRYRYLQRQQGKDVNGSELYLAKGSPRKNIPFSNEAIARGTCVCCRIAMTEDINGHLAVFWRHIFGDNIREFALLTLDKSRPALAQVKQISQDHWYIEGCPHQGGAISIDSENRYHLIWYNQGDKGKGIFYANSIDAGVTLSTPIAIGNNQQQAAHPHLLKTDDIIDIVWLEFTGEKYQLWHQQSHNNGKSFSKPQIIAYAKNSADRPFIINHLGKRLVSWQRSGEGHWISAL